jgi:hypothetical protein
VAGPHKYPYLPASVKKPSDNIVANQSCSTGHKARLAIVFAVRIKEIGHGYQDRVFTASIFDVGALTISGK